MRNGHETAVRDASNSSRVEGDIDSTEDMWSEDKYITDAAYLPSPPHITVNVSAIQPNHDQLEPKREMDETWDYDYDSPKSQRGVSIAQRSRLCPTSLGKNLTLTNKEDLNLKCARVSPAFQNRPHSSEQVEGNRSPRHSPMIGEYRHRQRPNLSPLRPAPLRFTHGQPLGYIMFSIH